MSDTIQMTQQEVKRTRAGFLVLSTLALLFLGLIYAFSMFAKPMTADFGISGSISLTFNIMMITFCLGAICGSFLDRRYGVRSSLVICAVLFALGFVGTGLLAPLLGALALYLFYGVIGGLGCGIGYNTIIATTNVWFPDRVGFSSGVLMMGFGVASLVFGNLALVVRPLVGGMGSVLIIIGVLVAVLVFILAFRLKRPPSDIVALMAPDRAQVDGAEKGDGDNPFKTSIFYVYYLWNIVIVAIGLAAIGSCAADATALGVTSSFASILVGLVSTFNGLARIILGAFYDKTGLIATMLVDAAVALAAVVLITFAFATTLPTLYIIGALLCGFAYGGAPVIASVFARQRYGAKRYPTNLSIVNLSIAFGSFVNIGIAAAIGAGNRLAIFTTILVLAVIAFAITFLFARLWRRDVGGRSS